MSQGNKPQTTAKDLSRKPDDKPDASERAALLQALRDKGVKANDANAIIKADRSRKQIRDDLIALLRDK